MSSGHAFLSERVLIAIIDKFGIHSQSSLFWIVVRVFLILEYDVLKYLHEV